MPAPADPALLALQADLTAVRAELALVRGELAQLGTLVQELRDGLLGPAAPEPAPAPSASAVTWLARRNGERLAGEVQRRQALGPASQDDTELDLLIDRLHELALETGA